VSPRVGITLPTFTADVGPAIATARIADEGGLDGVFAFDHLWPMGAPGRPALWSFGVLGAVAAATRRIAVGPLVARVGLLPEDDLLSAFRALGAVAGSRRVIAGLGTGDRLNAPENMAFGAPYPSADERLRAVERAAIAVASLGVEVWLGGGSDATGRIAASLGLTRNLWGIGAEVVALARDHPGHVPQVTWGGEALIGRDEDDLQRLQVRYGTKPGWIVGTVGRVAEQVRDLGAEWCVLAPLDYIDAPERAAESVCLVREAVR
jgi:alkanesulfonate monooxygenase SsuD/methylene tetrahydromethanopterin reductase-like flavin-dependent oxidoreductase (luciferase family)